jgi:hypothetical protein
MHPGSRHLSAFASILAAGSLATGPSAAADEPLDPTAVELRLVLVDLCDTAPELRHGALRGIRTLLEPVGIRVTSRTAFPGEDEASGGVYVVLMPFDPSRPRTQPVGGTARGESGRQLTVWAFPPMVAGGLGLDLAAAVTSGTPAVRAALAVVGSRARPQPGRLHRSDGLPSARLARQLLDSKLADADLVPPPAGVTGSAEPVHRPTRCRSLSTSRFEPATTWPCWLLS